MMHYCHVITVSIILIGCNAHFPLVDNAHGGDIFSRWNTAAKVTDITRSSSTSRVALCDHLYLWLEFDRPDDFDTLMVGGTVPVIERFKDNRVAVAVFGRGLPGIDATESEIQEHCNSSPVGRLCKGYNDLPKELQIAFSNIQDSLGVDDLGVIAVPGVDDQTNCDFGEDPLTLQVKGDLYVTSSGGYDEVQFATYHTWDTEHCYFHEEFGGSDMWIVQDKLIELAGPGQHYIAFWSPDDNSLEEPIKPAKFGAVFGDKGQSEDFNGDTILAGDCSLPSQDFYEQDCHSYKMPWLPSVIEKSIELIFDEQLFTSFFYLPWGGAPCTPSYAATVPNVYNCNLESSEDTPKACTNLCHNHGACPASENEGSFNITECTSDTNSDGFPQCGETCARKICGSNQKENTAIQRGPIGPACSQACTSDCFLYPFFCTQKCDMEIPESDECRGIYEEDEE